MTTLQELKQERIDMLARIAEMTADLRGFKHLREIATDPASKEAARRNVARTIHSINRAHNHLSTLKEQIRVENIRIHESQKKVAV